MNSLNPYEKYLDGRPLEAILASTTEQLSKPMRKFVFYVCAFAMLVAGTLNAQDIASTWQGTFTSGAEQHRAVLQKTQKDGCVWEATAFYIEFFPDTIHIDSLVVNGSTVKFTINGGKGAYEGRIVADGASILGTWTYEGHPALLELRHATKETAWHVPFQYQYHFKDVTILRPSPDEPKIPFSPRLAVDYMDQGAVAWTGERQCVACHTNGSYMVVRPLMTAQLGPPKKELRDFFISTLQAELATDPEGLRPELDSTQAVYVAAGLAIWDAHVTHRLSPKTASTLCSSAFHPASSGTRLSAPVA